MCVYVCACVFSNVLREVDEGLAAAAATWKKGRVLAGGTLTHKVVVVVIVALSVHPRDVDILLSRLQ